MQKNKPWIKIIKDAYRKARPYLAFSSVICISLSPLVTNPTYKVIALSVISSLLISIILDLFSEIDKRFNIIDSKMGVKEPPTYLGFTEALPAIRQTVKDKWLLNQDIDIKVIAVSAQFSWKNIVEVLVSELIKYKPSKAILKINFILVDPETLKNWGQKKLSTYCTNVRALYEIVTSSEEFKQAIDKKRLEINICYIDNIPHWHGLLINEDVLYLGRCSWDMSKDHKEMLVGRREYRRFENNDRFQGNHRIELFQNWFEAYQFRSSFNPHAIDETTEKSK